MGSANPARTLHGLSPCSKSVRTQTAHFVSYTSYLHPKVCVFTSYYVRTRGFIRGSIPLSSTIKRLVRRGSGKANGQKPKMYGHADRIDGQDKGSGKLPRLLDCCALTAYSCPMTTSENAQRDELTEVIRGIDGPATLGGLEVADAILAAGYRKPRTIDSPRELDALPFGSVVLDYYEVAWTCSRRRTDGTLSEWLCTEFSELVDSHYVLQHGPVTVLHSPKVTR